MILATIHGLVYRIIPGRMQSKIVKSLEKGLIFVLEYADYLIAVSETTKEELIAQIGVAADRIYVVSHGVDKQFRKNIQIHYIRAPYIEREPSGKLRYFISEVNKDN